MNKNNTFTTNGINDVGEEEKDDGKGSDHGEQDKQDTMRVVYFDKADVLIATPQRLLRHLDSTAGLRLLHLRLLVIDEADQVLAGNFANFVSKVVDRFEEEVQANLQKQRMVDNCVR
uniref:ATP-dependent RNA helicase n=1 Tax=Lygus hesperus TaxID=30085 RepID=A0A0A9ZFB5_LYGHE